MNDNEKDLEALAAKAKKQLAEQQNPKNNEKDKETSNSNKNIYKDIFDDENKNVTLNKDIKNDKTQPNEQMSDKIQERIIADAPELAKYDNDELFPGGPTKAQIQQWKKEWDGYDIFVTEILNDTFVFRTLNRFEYKQLVSFVDINALQREETICNTVTLWPENYNYNKMATSKAGVPSTYAEIIMEKSGFTKDFAIQEI